MDGDDPADRIRQRMAELRRELSDDVEDVGRSARAMADPGPYVRRFPWAAVVVAMAVGYLLVPKKKEVVYPDPDLLAKLVKQNRVRVETNASEGGPKGLVKNLLAMGVMAGARGGLNYIVQRMTSPSQSPVATVEAATSFDESN